MINSEQGQTKAEARTGLKQELTFPKIVAGVGIGLLGTFITWLGGLLIQKVSLLDYLWPVGVVVFLSLLVLLIIIDNIRLRRRAVKAAATPATTTRELTHHVSAIDPSEVVGREDEIGKVVEFVRADERKFLCLQGPGGVGKTTVARAALGSLNNLRMAFVEVDAIEEKNRDPLEVDEGFAVAVATKLGIPLVSRESPVEAVANALRLLGTPTVLIIDNVEQMATRAALIIQRWVQENPLVRVIVTSRVKLNVHTEKVLEIRPFQPHPLNLAPAEMLKDPGPALNLFARLRADEHAGFRLNEENVTVVNRICDAVGGLPLGIELAAAVEATLPEIEAGIKERSDYLESSAPDLPTRHRSLAAVIDWSLRLLDSDSYSLLLQLSVAPVALDDEAINGIVRLASSSRKMHVLLSVLVHAKLLVRSECTGRSTYREPIEVRRRCTELRLAERREEITGAWARFTTTFAARAEAAYEKRYGPDLPQALDELDRDYDNLVSVAQSAEPTDPTVAAKVAVCLAWLISIRRPSEPRLETLKKLAAIVPGQHHALLSQLQTALSEAYLDICIRTGEKLEDAAVELAERAVKTGEASGNHTIIGEAHEALALALRRRAQQAQTLNRGEGDDLDKTIQALDAATQHFIAARQFDAAAIACATWSSVPPDNIHKDKLTEARRLLGTTSSPIARYSVRLAEFFLWQQSQAQPSTDMRHLTGELRELAREIKSTSMEIRALQVTALLESELDDQERALEAMKERAALQRTAGAPVQSGLTMSDMAAVLLRRRPLTNENLDAAIAYLDSGLELVEGRGLGHEVAIVRGNRAWALFNRGRLKEALADSKAAIIYFEELLEWDRTNAFIQATMRAQILHGAGDVPGSKIWADKALQLANQHGLSEASLSPEVRRHVKWLREYKAAASKEQTT